MLPLLDREAELADLQRAVGAVVRREGGVVVVEGAPGAGKTRLLEEARALATRAGLRVLAARGGELEREHPYGIVRQLFETALLGPEQAPWISGPAAGAASVFRPETAVEAAPFMTLGGLYWLTFNVAADGPLVLLVDDLHWADPPSVHFLQYLVRRLEGLPVLLVLGVRPGESEPLADLAAAPAASLLRPPPLSQEAAGQLTRELLGVAPAERFAAACWRATGGNPLLIVELLRALRAEGITPDDGHVDVVDRVGPSALARIVLLRLRRLPADALAVAQAIALLGTGAAPTLVAELAEVGEAAVDGAVAALIGVDVLEARSRLGFVHPIVREAIYRELAPDQRDRRHLRAAELLRARGAAPDQVGAHLLLVAPRGEPWIAQTLQDAAADAAQRGAVETAVTFLRRALDERPGDPAFALRHRLGLTEAAIDPEAAVAHLEAAGRVAPDPGTGARIAELVVRLLVFHDPPRAVAVARRARAELPGGQEGPQASLLALERYAGRFSGVEPAAFPDARPPGASGRTLLAVRAWDQALSGGSASGCVALAADALLLDEEARSRQVFVRNPLFTAMIASTVLLFADDLRAQGFWDTWHAEAVRSGRAHAVIAGDIWQGWLRLRLGDLPAAEAVLRATLEGPRVWGPGTGSPPPHALSLLAEVLLHRGDEAGAQAVLDRVPVRARADTEGVLRCSYAQMRLRVAQGRHPEALELAEAVGEQLRTIANPAWAPWRSVHAQALAQVGRREEAVAAVTEELALARAWGTPAPIGRALTLLGSLGDRVELLEEAVEVTHGPFARLEHAAALLALGAAVRRRRRPADARAWLRDAHDLAVRCGAEGLARQARDELAAAGGRARPVPGSGATALTPSERRVAELAAAGRRNQEIAQQLHLSPKTVEVHLSSSYRKLGIRRRGELDAALTGSPSP